MWYPSSLNYLALALGFVSNVQAQGNLGNPQTSCGPQDDWVDMGCYSTDNTGRHANFIWQLAGPGNSNNNARFYPGYDGNANMTVDVCKLACRGHGYKYMATFYGIECYCGSIFPDPNAPASNNAASGPGSAVGNNPLQTVDQSECQAQCQGNTSEYCGGTGAAQVYMDPSFPTSTSVSAATNYQYLGCYNNINPGPMYTQIATPDTPTCVQYCGQLGFPYAQRNNFDANTGAQSCGCGTEIQSGYQTDESTCNFYCNGTEHASGGVDTCGGDAGFSVFLNTQMQGCFAPNIPGTGPGVAYVAPADAGRSVPAATGSSGSSTTSSSSSSSSSSSTSSSSSSSLSSTTTSNATSTPIGSGTSISSGVTVISTVFVYTTTVSTATVVTTASYTTTSTVISDVPTTVTITSISTFTTYIPTTIVTTTTQISTYTTDILSTTTTTVYGSSPAPMTSSTNSSSTVTATSAPLTSSTTTSSSSTLSSTSSNSSSSISTSSTSSSPSSTTSTTSTSLTTSTGKANITTAGRDESTTTTTTTSSSNSSTTTSPTHPPSTSTPTSNSLSLTTTSTNSTTISTTSTSATCDSISTFTLTVTPSTCPVSTTTVTATVTVAGMKRRRSASPFMGDLLVEMV